MPPREYHFWVYILSSRSRNLYIGMTNNLPGRVLKHREKVPGTHTGHYNIHRLVYFEYFQYVRSAIAREKELKHWTRAQKIALIEKVNPTWADLSESIPHFPEKQIPSGNDRKKGNDKKKSNNSSPMQIPCGNDRKKDNDVKKNNDSTLID